MKIRESCFHFQKVLHLKEHWYLTFQANMSDSGRSDIFFQDCPRYCKNNALPSKILEMKFDRFLQKLYEGSPGRLLFLNFLHLIALTVFFKKTHINPLPVYVLRFSLNFFQGYKRNLEPLSLLQLSLI